MLKLCYNSGKALAKEKMKDSFDLVLSVSSPSDTAARADQLYNYTGALFKWIPKTKVKEISADNPKKGANVLDIKSWKTRMAKRLGQLRFPTFDLKSLLLLIRWGGGRTRFLDQSQRDKANWTIHDLFQISVERLVKAFYHHIMTTMCCLMVLGRNKNLKLWSIVWLTIKFQR